jgi:hypothetical protein
LQGIIQKINIKVMAIGIIIVLLIIFGTFQYIDKQKYVKYMSNELSNDLGNMNRHILMNDRYLTRILETKEISNVEAKFLRTINGLILASSSTYQDISIYYLKKADHDEISNLFSNTASDFNHFFWMLEDYYFTESDTIKLDSKKLEQLKVMKEINDLWVHEVEKHLRSLNNDFTTEEQVEMLIEGGEYHKIYDEDNIIAQDNWVILLKELSKKTEQYLDKQFPNLIYDFTDFIREDLSQL